MAAFFHGIFLKKNGCIQYYLVCLRSCTLHLLRNKLHFKLYQPLKPVASQVYGLRIQQNSRILGVQGLQNLFSKFAFYNPNKGQNIPSNERKKKGTEHIYMFVGFLNEKWSVILLIDRTCITCCKMITPRAANNHDPPLFERYVI